MRYRVSNIPLWLDEDDALLTRRAAERLGISPEHLSEALVVRRSLDARKRGHPRWLVNLEVEVEGSIAGTGEDVAPVPAPEPAARPRASAGPAAAHRRRRPGRPLLRLGAAGARRPLGGARPREAGLARGGGTWPS